jgi:hypothetical protein
MPNFLSKLYYRHRHGIVVHRNVLTEEERVKLLEDSKNHLKTVSPRHPGLQTHADLNKKLYYENYLTLIKLLKRSGSTNIHKCWVNYSEYGLGQTTWHKHECKLTSIYYLENPENIGTIFRHKGKEFRIDVPTNTLMIIPGSLEHTGPYTYVSNPRYTLTIDTNK